MKTITEIQQEYAEYCGYKDFEELRKKDERALRYYYMQMLKANEMNEKYRGEEWN